MSFLEDALLSVAGPVVGGLFGGKSNKEDNKNSAQAAAAANAFTERQMQNRHQWEVEDLRKAGLNPILSAGSAPSMGSSAQAQTFSKSDAQSKGAAVGSTALQNALAIKLQKAQIDNLQSQSTNQLAQAGNAEANTALTGYSARNVAANTTRTGIQTSKDIKNRALDAAQLKIGSHAAKGLANAARIGKTVKDVLIPFSGNNRIYKRKK